MTFNKNGLYAVIVAIMGCVIFMLQCHKSPVVPARKVTPTAEIQKKAQADIRKYQDKLDSLQNSNDMLQKQSELLSAQLAEARLRNKKLQKAAAINIDRINEAIDTTEKLIACDSLQSTVDEMIVVSDYKDSLYESAIGTFKAAIANKDSCIGVYQQAQLTLQQTFDQTLAEHDQLSEENKVYKRQARNQTVENKVLTAGIVFIAGVATYSLIKH